MKPALHFSLLLGLLVWFTGMATTGFSQPPVESGHVIIKSATAKVMSGASVVGQVRSGQRLSFTQRNGNWYFVEFQQDGRPSRGWVHGNDVRVETAPSVPARKAVSIEGWGALFDPAGDATAVKKNGAVELSVPGVYRDLWLGGRVNSPRILQPVKGDFAVQVKVTSPVDVAGLSLAGDRPADARSIYRGAVLIIWHDENNFIRLERASSHTTERFWYCKAYIGGEFVFNTHGIVRPDAASYLRIQRKQGTFYASYRQEGDREWTTMEGRRLDLPAEVKVGVSLINTTSKPFTVRFEELVVESVRRE